MQRGNKGADQLRSYGASDQRLCFRYTIWIVQLKQFDLAPPSSLARAEASFGRVHLTALGGIRELQQKEEDDNGDDDLFAVTHLNP